MNLSFDQRAGVRPQLPHVLEVTDSNVPLPLRNHVLPLANGGPRGTILREYLPASALRVLRFLDGIHLEQTKIFARLFCFSLVRDRRQVLVRDTGGQSIPRKLPPVGIDAQRERERADNTLTNPESPAYDGSPVFIPLKGDPASRSRDS